MDSTERVTCFVSDDLPFSRRVCDDIGACDALLSSLGIIAICNADYACLPEPGESDFGAGCAVGEKGPVRVTVLLLASPRGEEVESI